MKTKIIWIGKNKEPFVTEGVKMFRKRLNRYTKLEILELDAKSKSKQPDAVMRAEADLLRKRLSTKDFVILLDEKGKVFDSRSFANEIQKLRANIQGDIVFVIGGAYGFAKEIKLEANLLISMSSLTFSHQMIRLIFMEQLYRAFCIINNHPYHND